jgi:hypothetical protein
MIFYYLWMMAKVMLGMLLMRMKSLCIAIFDKGAPCNIDSYLPQHFRVFDESGYKKCFMMFLGAM